MDFMGGLIIGGVIGIFAMALITAGKDDRNDD
jgi:gas vesicle protein